MENVLVFDKKSETMMKVRTGLPLDTNQGNVFLIIYPYIGNVWTNSTSNCSNNLLCEGDCRVCLCKQIFKNKTVPYCF